MAIYSGFSHWKLWFSIVMLNYQRVQALQNLQSDNWKASVSFIKGSALACCRGAGSRLVPMDYITEPTTSRKHLPSPSWLHSTNGRPYFFAIGHSVAIVMYIFGHLHYQFRSETLSMTAHSNFGVEFTTTGPFDKGAPVLLGRWWWRWRCWGTLTFGCLEQGLVVVDLVHRVWNQSNFLRLHYWVTHWALVVLLQGGCEDRMPGWKIAGRTVGPVLLQHAHARSNAEGRDILAWMLVRHGETWTLGVHHLWGLAKVWRAMWQTQ